VLRALGDLRDAIRVGTEAHQQAPGDGDVLYALGHAYWAHGDRVAARRYFEAFLQSKPELEVSVEVRGILDAIDKKLV
jgi:Flp pilus assembly protein TadD